MGYFPLCVDLRGKKVILVGEGPQIRDKLEKLRPFGAELVQYDGLTAQDLKPDVAFVVAGDLEIAAAEQISSLCRACRVPVNVVDRPALCTFFFPATITRGELTVSVSTGGRSPGAAGIVRQRIGEALPDETEAILNWLESLRARAYAALPREEARTALRKAASRAFDLGRVLTDGEMVDIFGGIW